MDKYTEELNKIVAKRKRKKQYENFKKKVQNEASISQTEGAYPLQVPNRED